jgi:hypothetical protein
MPHAHGHKNPVHQGMCRPGVGMEWEFRLGGTGAPRHCMDLVPGHSYQVLQQQGPPCRGRCLGALPATPLPPYLAPHHACDAPGGQDRARAQKALCGRQQAGCHAGGRRHGTWVHFSRCGRRACQVAAMPPSSCRLPRVCEVRLPASRDVTPQAELESALFGLMAARGFDEPYIRCYRMVTAFYQQRQPLVILICGTAWTGARGGAVCSHVSTFRHCPV